MSPIIVVFILLPTSLTYFGQFLEDKQNLHLYKMLLNSLKNYTGLWNI